MYMGAHLFSTKIYICDNLRFAWKCFSLWYFACHLQQGGSGASSDASEGEEHQDEDDDQDAEESEYQFRDERREGMGPCATYVGYGQAQLLLDSMYEGRESFPTRPMSGLAAFTGEMPEDFNDIEAILARSVFKINRDDGACATPIVFLCSIVNQSVHLNILGAH